MLLKILGAGLGLVALTLGLVAFLASPARPTSAETKLEVRLDSATTPASGKAKFESRSDRVRFSTEVEDMSSDGFGTVLVLHEGTVILDQPVEIVAGVGDLNLDSRDGDAVPNIVQGDVVQVFFGGELILTGTF